MKSSFPLVLLSLLLVPLTARGESQGDAGMPLTISSPAFKANSGMPVTSTCEGKEGAKDVSPALEWANLPASAKSLVLIVDDPDAPDPKAPKMTWVHWLLYNLPVDSKGLPEGIKKADLPKGTLEGISDFKRTGYGGPCPPVGKHRYFFKLYALDAVLPDLKSPKKPELEKAMQGHIVEKAELIGLYQKKGG
jgi:Raf kinase inhibitor-like YbhB/YbcL family protein